MTESIGLKKVLESGGEGWRRGAGLLAVLGGLLLAAVVFGWLSARDSARIARQLTIANELQLAARDAGVLASRAVGADAAVTAQLRKRSTDLDSALALLSKGEMAPSSNDSHQGRLQEFATRWSEFKRRTEALLALAAVPETAPGKEAARSRAPEKRPPSGPAQKAASTQGGRAAELSAAAATLQTDGIALAAASDAIRTELDRQQQRTPWLLYLALLCGLAAATVPALFGVLAWRSGLQMRQSAQQMNAAVFDALKPALRTLHIRADSAAMADPVALGRRLSDELLVVIDGIKTLVKALNTATAEADKFAVLSHVGAQALAKAERNAAEMSVNLQATARRIAAGYNALSTGTADAQQHCEQSLKTVSTGATTARDCVRLADQLCECLSAAAKQHVQIVAMHNEISQSLHETAELLAKAEGLTSDVGAQLDNAASQETARFIQDVGNYLGPSLAMLKRSIELAQRVTHESGDCSNALGQASAGAAVQSRAASDSSHMLASAELTLRELTAKLASMARLASGPEASRLVSALDEAVRQFEGSASSARQVLDATKHAAAHIEELAKLLNDLKPA